MTHLLSLYKKKISSDALDFKQLITIALPLQHFYVFLDDEDNADYLACSMCHRRVQHM